jgi:hypothetical protein
VAGFRSGAKRRLGFGLTSGGVQRQSKLIAIPRGFGKSVGGYPASINDLRKLLHNRIADKDPRSEHRTRHVCGLGGIPSVGRPKIAITRIKFISRALLGLALSALIDVCARWRSSGEPDREAPFSKLPLDNLGRQCVSNVPTAGIDDEHASKSILRDNRGAGSARGCRNSIEYEQSAARLLILKPTRARRYNPLAVATDVPDLGTPGELCGPHGR